MPDLDALTAFAQEAEKWCYEAETDFEYVRAELRVDLLAPILKVAKKGTWDNATNTWRRSWLRYTAQLQIWRPLARRSRDPEGHALTAHVALKLLTDIRPMLGL